MKVLIVSDAPWHYTGYGTQVRELCRRLHTDGHTPVVFCSGAFMGGKTVYEGTTVVGGYAEDDRWGNRSIGDIVNWCQPDLILTWLDAHYMPNYGWNAEPTYFWAPIDTDPVPKSERMTLGRAAKVLACSKWGQAVMSKHGIESAYVPCGLDTKTFYIDLEGGQRWRKQVRPVIDEDTFLIGMVGLNTGSPDRKGYGFAFDILKRFKDNHPDDKIVAYIHCDPAGQGGAIDLTELREERGMSDWVALSAPMLPWGATAQFMRDMYNAFDVFLHTSPTEGFGIPVVEAQACGKPVVVNACTSVSELAQGPGGYRSTRTTPMWINTSTQIYLPDVAGMTLMLESAYTDWKNKRLDPASISASVAQYEWDEVWERYWKPALADVPAPLNYEDAGGKVGPKLMLAAGSQQRDGFIHHDREKLWEHIDVAHDLTKFPWPWEDDSFGYIEFEDCLEHLRSDITEVFDELHRILKPGGYLYLHTAEAGTWQLMKDPTHVVGFKPESFNYFDPETQEGAHYSYSVRKWQILKRTTNNAGLVFVMTPRKEAPVVTQELEGVAV